MGVRFDLDGAHAQVTACALVGGDVGTERREGSFEADGDELTIVIERSTCVDDPRVSRATFKVVGDQLTLDGPSGRLLFERLESDGTGNGVFVNGCWDGDSLVLSDLQPL